MSNKKRDVLGSDSSIGSNDVLLGRGNHLHNSGNEKFRSLVRSRSIEYWSCNDNVMKDNIARQIVDSVASQQGRFLRRVKISSSENNPGGSAVPPSDTSVSVPTEMWEVADIETVLVKIKQTFRDFTASNKKREGASSYKKHPSSTSEESHNLQQVSILERLQNYNNLASSPFITLPDTSTRTRIISSLATPRNDSHEMLFQNARASQLDHLVHNAQEQLRSKGDQDQQLLSLFEQQRAILMTQLQQSSLASEKKTQVNQVFPSQQVPQLQGQFNTHRQLSAQPSQATLHPESIRLSNSDLQLQPTLSAQQLYQSHQDRFAHGQYDQGHQPYFIDQQLQLISRLDGAAPNQSQFTLTNQNVQQNQILSSMNLNEMSNTQNLLLQSMLHNSSPMSTIVQPPTQTQQAPISTQNNMAEHFNEFLIQRSNFPLSVTNMMTMSSNRSINDLLAFSGQVQLPDSTTHPHPTIQQTTTSDNVNQSVSLCYENEDDNEEDKKPPAH